MPRRFAAQQLELESTLVPPPRPKTAASPSRDVSKRGGGRANGAAKNGMNDSHKKREQPQPSSAELILTPGALLTRSHLRQLGLERRAIDAVFRSLPVVALPGYSRPMIRAEQYLELVERHTYRDDRVRACHA